MTKHANFSEPGTNRAAACCRLDCRGYDVRFAARRSRCIAYSNLIGLPIESIKKLKAEINEPCGVTQ